MQYEVIPAVHWRNVVTQQTASIYGAVPWGSSTDKHNWEQETIGWTVRNPLTNEVGIGRKPWESKTEAEAFAAKYKPSRICIGD